MLKRLKGKRALITAAGQGIGKATADLFIAEGAEVYATDINSGALEQLVDGRSYLLDVTDNTAIQNLQLNSVLWIFCLIVQATFITARSWIAVMPIGISLLT